MQGQSHTISCLVFNQGYTGKHPFSLIAEHKVIYNYEISFGHLGTAVPSTSSTTLLPALSILA